MKIAILQDDFPPRHVGGSGIVAHQMAMEYLRQGHEVLVVTAVQDKDFEGAYTLDGLVVKTIFSSYPIEFRAWLSLWNPMVSSKLQSILYGFQPDIIHIHNIHIHLSYFSLRIARKTGAKVFLTLHDAMSFHYGKLVEFINLDNPSCNSTHYKISAWQQIKKYRKSYNPFRNIVIRHYIKYAHRIFAVSNVLREALKQNGITRVEVMRNGIRRNDWEVDATEVQEFRKNLNLDGKKIILFGGRLSALKGGEQAVRALADIVKDVPNAYLMVIGKENAYARTMQLLARSLNIENHILFTGWLSGNQLKAAYHATDVVWVLSLYLDPLVLFNLEAMACKKPVIGTCFGGTKEVVENGKTGYIINPYEVGEIVSKTTSILNNSRTAEILGNAGYQRVESEFSLEENIKILIEEASK